MPNNGNYPNFGGFSQTFGVNAKILGFYTLGTHYCWGYPNFESADRHLLLSWASLSHMMAQTQVEIECD